MNDDVKVLERLYDRFNARDIDTVLTALTDEVVWANGMDGGFVHGREAVRAYWTRQWAIVSPHVEPVGFHRTADGTIVAEVRQTIHDLEGKPLQGQTHGLKDKMVGHVFHLRNGKVARFDIRGAAYKAATEPEMSKALSNKVALITGSSRGIGRAAALVLAKEGASFIGVHYASNADAAHSTVHEIEALGAKAVAIEADLRRGKDATDNIWQQFKTAAIATTGEPWLDILVNNAGVAPALSLADTSEAVFDEILAINLKAPFFLIQAVADYIRDNGRIINISTGFTRVAAPTHPAYAASKGALETLTLALAPEFGTRGITVNTVMPGVTETDMNAAWLVTPEARAGAEAMSVFSRVGQPADVADVIAFLASNKARWVTGQVTDATGGTRL